MKPRSINSLKIRAQIRQKIASWSEGSPKECQPSKKQAKETQRESAVAKGSQREPNENRQATKREPKVYQNASQSRSMSDIRKRLPKRYHHELQNVIFGNSFLSNIDANFNAKIDGEQVMENAEQMVRAWFDLLSVHKK